MRGAAAATLACLLTLTATAESAKSPTSPSAASLLQAGEADKALNLLNTQPQTAEVHNLRCRVLLTLERWDAAANECEQAVRMDGRNSNYHLWLGRALGERADRASFMSAYGLGKRVRQEFEAAVQLDGRNAEALADLGEFYKSAPSIVGGGADKAANVAAQLDHVDAARAHQLRGWTAESQKDYGTAERELREATNVDPHPAFAWMSVASFYRRRQRWTDLDTALQNGIKAAQRDRQAAIALYNGSSILTKANRNLPLAAKMLEDYLASSSKTEEGPAFVAYTRLAKVRAQLGDRAGAEQARQAALALAHDYKPALDLKF